MPSIVRRRGGRVHIMIHCHQKGSIYCVRYAPHISLPGQSCFVLEAPKALVLSKIVHVTGCLLSRARKEDSGTCPTLCLGMLPTCSMVLSVLHAGEVKSPPVLAVTSRDCCDCHLGLFVLPTFLLCLSFYSFSRTPTRPRAAYRFSFTSLSCAPPFFPPAKEKVSTAFVGSPPLLIHPCRPPCAK